MKRFGLLLFVPLIAFAQFQFIPISADFATFRSTDTTAYVEVYVSIFQGNLEYQEVEPGKFMASFTSSLVVFSDVDSVRSIAHDYKNTTADTSRVSQYNQFVDIFSFELPYGVYQAKVQMEDHQSGLRGEYILELPTIKPEEQLFFSDIEFCNELKRDDGNTIYNKNSLKVVPNPRRVYDVLQPMLYFYVELHNLPYSAGQKNYYEFEYLITTIDGDTMKQRGPATKEIFGPSQVEAGGLNVMSLTKNPYFLTANAKNLSTGETATTRRRFFVYKPSPEDTVQATAGKIPKIAEVFAGFSKEELEEEFAMAGYIAARDEQKIFENLENPLAMKKFLTEFWFKRDKTNNLPYGTTRYRYMQLAEFANENYRSMGREGWKTDRGRVLLLYGEPDEYERHPSSMNMVPHVIWRYHNLEGGQFFVFADMENFGDYRLIHSSYRKELQNPNWEALLRNRGGVDRMQSGEF